MSSSTSSSKDSLRALALAVGLFAGGNALLGKAEPRLSKDLVHVRAMPKVAESVKASRGALVFLGNSLTRHGVDGEVVTRGASAACPGVRTFILFPDDTTIPEWHAVFERVLVARDALPELLAIDFYGGQLADPPQLPVSRMAAHYYSPTAAWPTGVSRFDSETALEFGVAATLPFYGLRERVASRILSVLPGYQKLARAVHASRGAGSEPAPGSEPSYELLEEIAQKAKAKGTKLVVVAMPTRESYTIEPSLRRELALLGVPLWDMRSGYQENEFIDAIHLAPTGRQRLSEALGKQVSLGCRK